MNWLLFILRFVLGMSATEQADSPPVAIRPDGTAVVLLPKATARRRETWPWDWLLPHSFGRDPSLSAHSVVDDFEHGVTRYRLGDDARRRFPDEFQNR